MTSQPLTEEFPAQAEAPDIAQSQKAGSLALVRSIDRIPKQAESSENLCPEVTSELASEPKHELANKYALSFLGVVTKGYKLPEGVTQRDAEAYTEMVIGLINEVRVRKGSRREADEPHRLFVRGYSDTEISELLGNSRSRVTLSVMRCLDVKALHERGYKPRKLHLMLEKFVALEEGPRLHPKMKPESPKDQINRNTKNFLRGLLGEYEIPANITQKDAELFCETVLGFIHGGRPKAVTPHREFSESIKLFLRGEHHQEVARQTGEVRANRFAEKKSESIKLLHERGYPPVLLSYLLNKFLVEEQPEQLVEISIPEQRTRRSRKSPVDATAELTDDGPSTEELSAIEKNDDLDAEASTTDIVRAYLTEIGRVPLLNAEQEVQLAKQIEQARPANELLKLIKKERLRVAPEVIEIILEDAALGTRATNQMLEANLRLVVHWATRYQGKGLDLLDLIQEGNLGLVRGVEKFDHTLGYKFSTYATWWIRQALQRAIADKSQAVRIPVHMHERINKATKALVRLEDELGRRPTFAEVGESIGETPEKAEELLNLKKPMVYLDKPVGDDKESRLGDFIADKGQKEAIDVVEVEMRERDVNEVLNTLPSRSATVLRMRFGIDDGIPKTLDEVGRVLGLTRERIRQIERDTIADLRKNPDAITKLKDYVA